MVKYSAPLCGNATYKKTPDITFHRFPKDEIIKLAWVTNMKKQDLQPTSSSVLCSKHFEDHLIDKSGFRTVLVSGAIPTIFDLLIEADQSTSSQEPPVATPETSIQIKEEQLSESEFSYLSEKDKPVNQDGGNNDVLVKQEPEENGDENAGKPLEEWQEREQALLKRIEELEKIKTERSEDGLRLELKVREEEIDLLRSRVKNLETELQAALSKPAGKNQEIIQNIKQQHEELLSKARGMIFDKTKMVKNQELQIEALNSQVQSLKDINNITKDLLNIRNSEVKAMEDRLEAMEARYKAEKERHSLVLQRAQTSSGLNDDLKKEYETQLAIFKELRVKYEQRVQALVSENQQLKDLRKMTTPS
ncbi:epidermal growth factor receptor substrate 15 homolog isoform X2 [Pieris napi]|uniref:epidermal growth factor receptor substrate 15 homolog isoform X2 n=1 Tax=Pieris napi TaxID=78633 RepID=UPI001FBA719D|nr:epidermal growth factor receptor substrate 15 homolog isoform X2 [Pieris napi]